MTWLQPLFLLSLASILVLLFIYLRHPRRMRKSVSQVFLYLRARRELLTRFTRWRFLRSLILLFQVLTLVFLGLAAAGPQTALYPLAGRRCALVLDNSLSMMAQDLTPDRFQVAREKARQLAEELLRGNNQVSLWALNSKPGLVLDFTDELPELLQAIDDLAPSFLSPTSADDLLALLAARATEEALVVYVLSDLALELTPRQYPNLELHSLAVGEPLPNYALIGCAREGESLWVKVANFSPAAQTLHLVVDDGLAPLQRELPLEAMETVDLSILVVGTPSLLRVSIQEEDLQPWDNFLFLPLSAPPRVLLVGTSRYLAGALESAGFHVVQVGPEDYRPEIPADLLVFEGTLPSELPAKPFFVIHPPPGNAIFPWTGTVTRPLLWAETSALLDYVDLARVAFLEAPIIKLSPTMRPLLRSAQTTVLAAGQQQGIRTILLGPSLTLSNLPLLPAFPVFLAQAMRWLSGDPLPNQPLEEKALLLSPLVADYNGRGDPPGLYGRQAADGLRLFGVAPLEQQEANLIRHTELEGLGSTGEQRTVPRDLTILFLMLALSSLLLEEVLRRRYD